MELGIDRRVSPLVREIADVILDADADQRDVSTGYGFDVQMLKDILDDVKNVVLPELDRRAESMDHDLPGQDWPGGL